jgi:non-ribosomal peptide synthetase component F
MKNLPMDLRFFDVIFNYVNFHVYNELELASDVSYQEAQQQDLGKESFVLTNTAFDISVSALGDSLSLTYKLKKTLKNEVTLEKVHQYLETVLTEYAKNSNTKLEAIDFLSSEEKEVLHNKFETIVQTETKQKTIIDLFNEQVAKTPNSTAVVYEKNSITYKELDEQSSKLTYHLQKNYDIKANDFVGNVTASITLVNHLNNCNSKSRSSICAIDTELPIERRQFIVEETNIKALLTLSSIPEQMVQLTKNIVKVDTFEATDRKLPVLLTFDAEDLAYVIFTSGSTGKPKGVMVSHANIVDYTKGLFKHTEIAVSKSFALMSNIATDLGNTVLFGALLSGGSLHLPKRKPFFRRKKSTNTLILMLSIV